MSEEETEETREVHVSDEDFVNTLAAARKKQEAAEQSELQNLAQRLSILQQRLDQAKEKIKRDKAFHEAMLLEKVMGSAHLMLSVDDMEVRLQAKKLSMKSMTLLEEMLDREFPTNTAISK